ncbi:hypothetical protein Sdagh_51940 [Streptomyces daghestanicus]|uniref:Secreted protein n=1 Tax=Streptomyces daghestanicus TaxID=66885 RepID=A0ABQ3Q856_9ACTN|nr:hypothetical protein Sdagh_51940 [Streptomyces daghestanicus]
MPSAISTAVVITVASVGPYVFHTPACARQRAARSALSRSAPSTQFRTPDTACGSRTESKDGTTLATVTPESRIISASAWASVRSSLDAIASVPPLARVTATSSTEASKLKEANCKVTSPGPAPSTGPIAATRFESPPCATATPFGRPVDPDV